MEIYVLPSTAALPAINSFWRNNCGNKAYLIGPKKVDCNPIKKSTAISNIGLDAIKHPIANNISTSSTTFKTRVIVARLYLSANRPAKAENKKYGKINKPAAKLAYKLTVCSFANIL